MGENHGEDSEEEKPHAERPRIRMASWPKRAGERRGGEVRWRCPGKGKTNLPVRGRQRERARGKRTRRFGCYRGLVSLRHWMGWALGLSEKMLGVVRLNISNSAIVNGISIRIHCNVNGTSRAKHCVVQAWFEHW
uniref:Uncharacterized protein n=1 Tax=Arundo donax TaxID=35708 RepID=A0A0A9GL94_ARUDO